MKRQRMTTEHFHELVKEQALKQLIEQVHKVIEKQRGIAELKKALENYES